MKGVMSKSTYIISSSCANMSLDIQKYSNVYYFVTNIFFLQKVLLPCYTQHISTHFP